MPAPRRNVPEESPSISITPMIDCVFLMLIYFMVTTSLQPEETALSFRLPASAAPASSLELPDEQILVIRDNGEVEVNGYAFAAQTASGAASLQAALRGFAESTAMVGRTASVVLQPVPAARQDAIVHVMDIVSRAGITEMRFQGG